MFIFGVVGYVMRLRSFPLAPMVLGVMIGTVADQSLRRALVTYSGNFPGMFMRPFGLVLLIAFIIIIYSQMKFRKKLKIQDE